MRDGNIALDSDKDSVIITVNGIEHNFDRGIYLSEVHSMHKPCGGHGKCGKCKVYASGALSPITGTEQELLTKEELSAGVRLACLTVAEGDCRVDSIRDRGGDMILTEGELPEIAIDPAFSKYGVAFDIGTTTLAARLYNTSAELLASAARLNPQSRWGADVISRIEAAIGGEAEEIAMAIRAAIDDMILELASAADLDPKEIDHAVVTGNTVMLSLFSGVSVEPFSHAPFEAPELFGRCFDANELGIKSMAERGRIYFPPCIQAFVGADTTCALLATGIGGSGETLMLADVGTNGEMAIYNNGELTVCSTAAGPAFEGVGISMGMRCADGAIDKVAVEDGKIVAHTVNGAPPCGICGSALVDAAACMLSLEILDESGYLEDEILEIFHPVYINQKDIRMLQLAKSAICAGLCTLVKSCGVSYDAVKHLYVAGGFGSYLSKKNASDIGLLPKKLAEVTVAVGNAALTGASMLLLSKSVMRDCERLVSGARVLDLSTDKTFSEYYISGMMLCEVE